MSDPLAPSPRRKPQPPRIYPSEPEVDAAAGPREPAGPRSVREALGAATLGLVAGMMLGFVSALAALALGFDRSALPFCVFGGGALGALAGAASTSAGFGAMEAALHVLGGLFAGASFGGRSVLDDSGPEDKLCKPSAWSSGWARILFWVAAVAGVAAVVALRRH